MTDDHSVLYSCKHRIGPVHNKDSQPKTTYIIADAVVIRGGQPEVPLCIGSVCNSMQTIVQYALVVARNC